MKRFLLITCVFLLMLQLGCSKEWKLVWSDAEIGFWNAWIFMSVFIWQMIIITFVNKRIRKRSHVPDEARQSALEKYIGIIANIVWFLALLYSVFLPLLLGAIWFYAGFFVFMIGLLVLAFATYRFITTPSNQLIQKGVYRISRHQMYLATFLICLGVALASASSIFILLSLILVLCLHYEALVEERYCIDTYKESYAEYMKRVPRWFGLPKN